MEKLDFLINYLLKENNQISIHKIPKDLAEKKRLYRSLCNIREPKAISKEYIQIENEYLQEELRNKKITKAKNIEQVANIFQNSNLEYKDKIYLWKGDITTLEIDSIVNAANSAGLRMFYTLPQVYR